MSLERTLKTLAGAPLKLGVCLLLGALFAQGAWAQLNYSQSNGARAFAPVTPPASQVVNLSTQPISSVISPAGFTFNYAGALFSNFMIARGFVALGSVSAPSQSSAYDLALHHCLISPCGTGDLRYGTGSEIGWVFQAGVLTVQWRDMQEFASGGGSPPVVSCQAVLDTGTGEIEFSYSINTGGPFLARTYPDIAALLGSIGSDGRVSVPAVLPGFVSDEGAMSDWPSGQFVRFTPTGSTRSAPAVRATALGSTLNHQNVAVASPGELISNLNLVITVDDADGDAVLVRADVNASAGTNVVASEFSSASAPVPYALQPSSGALPDFAFVTVLLRAHDGLDGIRTFVIYMRANNSAPPPRPSGSFVLGPLAELLLVVAVAGMKSGACVAEPGAAPFSWLALAALALFAGLRRYAFTTKNVRQTPAGSSTPNSRVPQGLADSLPLG